jgi:hypothetical protein
MRLAALLFLTVLGSANSLAAQDEPLGDVAREARARKSQAQKPAKIITNDEMEGRAGQPVSASDDPLTVVNRARTALLRDRLHVCRRETAGNSGPGWMDSRLIEVSGPDRKHILVNNDPKQGRSEYIIVAERVYFRSGNGPWERSWEKRGWDESKLAQLLESMELPEVLKFGFGAGDLKLIRTESVDGAPAFLYQYSVHAGDMDRTISIWIGANDGLPRKTDMTTVTRSYGSAAVSWREAASCSYGGDVVIAAPM